MGHFSETFDICLLVIFINFVLTFLKLQEIRKKQTRRRLWRRGWYLWSQACGPVYEMISGDRIKARKQFQDQALFHVPANYCMHQYR